MLVPGDPVRGLVPSYHFRIVTLEGQDAGHVNFRVGEGLRILMTAGHIGYGVFESFRGHGYAYKACRAIAPFVRTIYESVIITTNPENQASIHTIEKLGARFLDVVPVPLQDSEYQSGSRYKRRYEWGP
jgi:tagatose 1,6-diphosphate aldolase